MWCSRVCSFDVGITHLAFVTLDMHRDNGKLWIEIVETMLIDISVFKHHRVCREECTLRHEKTIHDWMAHVFQEIDYLVQPCASVLIERQPLQGLQAVEQAIFGKYREKAILVSPRSMHKYFKIDQLDYEQRKVAVVQKIDDRIAMGEWRMGDHQSWVHMARRHDIADAIAIAVFWCDTNRPWQQDRNNISCNSTFEQMLLGHNYVHIKR